MRSGAPYLYYCLLGLFLGLSPVPSTYAQAPNDGFSRPPAPARPANLQDRHDPQSRTGAAEKEGQGGGFRLFPADLVRPADDRVIARIDGLEIRPSQVIWSLAALHPYLLEDGLNSLLDDLLAVSDARDKNITLSRAEVDSLGKAAETRFLKGLRGVPKGYTFERAAREYLKVDPAVVRHSLRSRAAADRLRDYAIRYHSLQRRWARVRLIRLADPSQAKVIEEYLRQGANFEVLARQHSIDPSAANGGALPLLAQDDPNPITKIAFGLAPLTWIGPAEVSYEKQKSYVFVRLLSVVDAVKGTFPEIADQVRQSLVERPIDAAEYFSWSLQMNREHQLELDL